MKIKILLGSLLVMGVITFVSCAPAPAAPVKETVVVPQTVIVPQTVTVPQTVVMPATSVPQPTKASEPTKAVDLAAIQAAYKTSTHSNDYGEGRGPNTLCARCHSPRNWDPAAKPGPPPNCVACKFPFDKEVRKQIGRASCRERV